MTVEDVTRILDLLRAHGVRVWVDGGWGVDALVGEETREHSDLDLALDRDDLDRARAVLEVHGFTHDPVIQPGVPARLVMREARDAR